MNHLKVINMIHLIQIQYVMTKFYVFMEIMVNYGLALQQV